MKNLRRALRNGFCWLAAMATPLGCLLAQESPHAIDGAAPNVPPCSIEHSVRYPEHMVAPKYPKQALASGVGGSVELAAQIGADARKKDVRVISGDPALVSSALGAVREWRFRPMLVKGVPVDTTFRIKIRFNLLLQEAISEVEVESPQETVPVLNTVQHEDDPPEVEVYKLGQMGVVGPRPIYSPDPEFSEKARQAGEQGTVTVSLIVGSDGQPQHVRVACSSVPNLNENAIETVKTWRFDPGTKDGKPVAVQIAVEVDFHSYR